MRFLALFSILFCIVFVRAEKIHFSECQLFTDTFIPSQAVPFIRTSMPSFFPTFFDTHTPNLDEESMKIIQENSAFASECATPQVPMKHPDSTNKIRLFVKRLLAEPTDDPNVKKKAAFFLSGGPGGDPTLFETVMALLKSYVPNTDFYYLDHRGVARSQRLGCTASQAETKGSEAGVSLTIEETIKCLPEFEDNYGDDTNAFSTTQAAYDLKYLVENVAEDYPGGMILYGISYGTFWANRFLQLEGAPHGITQVVLDGLVSPKAKEDDPYTRTSLSIWDHWMNISGMRFMDFCDADKSEHSCSKTIKSKLDELNVQDATEFEYKNGRQFIELVFHEVFEKNKCKSKNEKNEVVDHWGFSKEATVNILAEMLTSYEARELIPALLFRLLRCDDISDHPVFENIKKIYEMNAQEILSRDAPYRSSSILRENIMLNELWDEKITPTEDDLVKQFNTSYFSNSIYKTFPIYTAWKKYEEPFLYQQFNNISIPIMLLNGDMDPQTPLDFAKTVYDHAQETCDNVQLFEVPYSPHFTLLQSLYTDVKEGRPTHCALDLMVQFINNAGFHDLDTSCLQRTKPPIIGKGDSKVSSLLFGVADKWDGVVDSDNGVRTVSLYLFIAVEAITVLIGAIIIGALVYAIVRYSDKQMNYDNLLDEEAIN